MVSNRSNMRVAVCMVETMRVVCMQNSVNGIDGFPVSAVALGNGDSQDDFDSDIEDKEGTFKPEMEKQQYILLPASKMGLLLRIGKKSEPLREVESSLGGERDSDVCFWRQKDVSKSLRNTAVDRSAGMSIVLSNQLGGC